MGGQGPRLSAAGQVQLAVRHALLEVAGPGSLRGGTVVVGVSGGPDSLALLGAAVHVAQGSGLAVHAVCVDHGWHRDSAPVAVRTARACADLGADHVRLVRVRPVRAGAGGWVGGPEDAARTARLAALSGAAERDGALAVLLGHTLDDQAEQVLLSLARGSGARALGGMAARRGPFVRPLLGLRRAVVRAACPDLPGRDLPWQDPSNTEPAYLRARVRAELLPVLADVLGPGAVESLARSAELLRADDTALHAWAEREAAALRPGAPEGSAPEGSAPEGSAPEGSAPEASSPEASALGGSAPEGSAPEASALGGSALGGSAPEGSAPEASALGGSALGGSALEEPVDVPVAPLLALPGAVRARVLRLLAARAGARALTQRHTRALEALVVDWRGQGPTALPGSVTASRTNGPGGCGRLRIARDRPPREDPHGRP